MSRKKAADDGEVLQSRSPAEFFAENQNIAGFDNPGKSLYTTVRELVENSLDASESIGRLPSISLDIEEFSQTRFEELRGIVQKRPEAGLTSETVEVEAAENPPLSQETMDSGVDASQETQSTVPKKSTATKKERKGKKGGTFAQEALFYRVTCRDNGVGMPHREIPDMLGRVLSGSKYGVRQTRGKFGLGAKMALIWAKKSTGLPIEVQTAHSARGSSSSVPSTKSRCVLDIDIFRNEPRVILLEEVENTERMTGTTISVTISGNWSTYRGRVMQYFQQLAIITPYAELDIRFSSPEQPLRSFAYQWKRRSTKMPPQAQEIRHHPASVNNLIVRRLMDQFQQLQANRKGGSGKATLGKFLTHAFSNVTSPAAKKVISAAGCGLTAATPVEAMDSRQVHALTARLRSHPFPRPSGWCLSPAGEYNLRLGIMKEMGPHLLATHATSALAFEGHPFVVEAGVALGGRLSREGISVYRFANRIPLLFEAGGDVVTKTATQRINWGAYKIDHRREKIGVFVSIVSTKIPFKGTGKEYIGDDILEIQRAVKSSLQECCKQLRAKLVRRNAAKEQAERKKNLEKYIPHVSRSFVRVLTEAAKRYREEDEPEDDLDSAAAVVGGGPESGRRRAKRQRLLSSWEEHSVSEEDLSSALRTAIARADHAAALDEAAAERKRTGTSRVGGVESYLIAPLPKDRMAGLPAYAGPNMVVRWLPTGSHVPERED